MRWFRNLRTIFIGMKKSEQKKPKANSFSILITVGIVVWIGVAIFNREKGSSEKGEGEELSMREAAVAGDFYPSNGDELASQIEEFYDNVDLEGSGAIKVLISPHAGYEYSGQVASFGYKQIIDKDIHTVVIVGPSHTMQFNGIAVFREGYWETPLGKVKVDAEMADEIISSSEKIYVNNDAHDEEHSVEVQIPFLQQSLGKFKVVPIVIGDKTDELVNVLVEGIFDAIDEYTLVVISSDLSHYPDFEDAQEVDGAIVSSILSGDTSEFEDSIADYMGGEIPNLSTCACGEGPILVGMKLASKLGIKDIRLLKYANSGSITGDKSSVVGYASIGFFTYRIGCELTKDEQDELLKISRDTLVNYFQNVETPDITVEHEYLNTKLGAFVTLKKNGELRGCIGNFEPTMSLAEVIQQLTIQSATKDSRFSPVQLSELDDITIEISVMSPRFEIEDPGEEIELGKHGVYIEQGNRAGVFLPQVATENNWDLETFLGQLCSQKAGLAGDCWKEDDTEIYVFTAQVFEE